MDMEHLLSQLNSKSECVNELLKQEKNSFIVFRVQGGKRSANLRIMGNGQGKLDDRSDWSRF